MRKNEVWRNVDFTDMIVDNMQLPGPGDATCHEVDCNLPDLDTIRITVVNGHCTTPFTVDDNGIAYGSLRDATVKSPDIVQKYIGNNDKSDNAYERHNADNFTDGVFIFVPNGVSVDKPFQIVSVSDSDKPLFVETRNLVIAGSRSALSLVQCDDSIGETHCLVNNVTELVCQAHSRVDLYKLQNINDRCGILNHCYTTCEEGVALRSYAISLNGGHIRNHTEIALRGEHTDIQADGLYLIDKEQQVDNYIFVNHLVPNCTSHELFKGILDDSARATFNGHVLVSEGATKTEAYQTNRNILLTDKATIQSKPFLEIYNDDVKCSHGSTTGQIDDAAMFYLQSRGISMHTARTLLLFAFCNEVIAHIPLTTLQTKLSDMVKKRLHGELTPCSQCALQCSTPCGNATTFSIDPDKL